ncbi:MAG: hypothetical protein GXP39_07985 [Chloroflexi bacterium]|nr:hypothetical protein [Chloroflexota bacterium]
MSTALAMRWRRSWKDSLIEAVRRTTDPVAFARAWLGWEPHDGQRRWLLAPERPTHVLVTGRRWGKSEVAAVQALYYAVFRPGTRQCIVSVTLDQARLVFDTMREFIDHQPLLAELVDRVRETPFPTVQLKHKSMVTVRTVARSGVYIRGHKFHRVIADEADYIPDRIIDEVIRLTLADVGGQLVLTTTPKPKRALVYRELRAGLDGDPAVYAQQGSSFENPNIHHDYLRSLRERMTEAAWLREIEGQYVADDTAVFRWDDIQAAYEAADWELPVEPQKNRRYVAGWDLAKTTDWTVGVVLDATEKPYRLVYFERFQRAPWPVVAKRIREVHRRYSCHVSLIDATGVGAPILDEVRDVAQGFTFTGRSKVDLLTGLQVALERRYLRFPFVRELVDELQAYEWDDKALVTDCVMSLALALWAAGPQRAVQYAPSIWD